MRRVLLNKWFLLALLLTISLSAFSVVAYQQARSLCSKAPACCKRQAVSPEKGELLWDVLSRQFSSISF